MGGTHETGLVGSSQVEADESADVGVVWSQQEAQGPGDGGQHEKGANERSAVGR